MKQISGGKSEMDGIVGNGKATVCIFSASWCGPCVGLKQKIADAKLEEELAANADFFIVDVDNDGEIAEEHNVEAMPTIKFFSKSGKVDDSKTIVGANYDQVKATAVEIANA